MQIIDIDLARAIQTQRRDEAADARRLRSEAPQRSAHLDAWTWAPLALVARLRYLCSKLWSLRTPTTPSDANTVLTT